MRRSRLLLIPALLVAGVVAVAVWRMVQVPDVQPTAPEIAVRVESFGDIRFEFEHRPGSETFVVARTADAVSVGRGQDQFEFRHGVPKVNATLFPSPAAGETVRWNLTGPLLINGLPVAAHRFQPIPLNAAPTELKWEIRNPSDAPRDSLGADWSRAGRVLVTAHGDGVIRVWDVEKKAIRTEIMPPPPTDGRKRWGFKAAVSPDGKTVAAANVQTQTVTLWEADTGNHIATLTRPEATVSDVRFASDRVLHEVRGGMLYSRDLTSDRTTVTLVGVAPAEPRAVSLDGTRHAAAADGNLTLGAGATVQRLWWRTTGRLAPIAAMAFFADGKTLAVGAADGLRLYDVESGRERGWVQTLSIRALAVSGDGAYLAAATEHGPAVLLWEVAKLQPR